MQIAGEVKPISASGMMAQKDFTIKAGAHMMQILSGLYKNPVDAVVREYLTNMYDAYLALERKSPGAPVIPPILILPNSLAPELVFKDNGIGMSMETVWEVYSQYGASTKSDSNLEVGGFGLGSKTAFCYNGGATWTIESRFDGMKHVFMACVGEIGIPILNHVTSLPTNEHSGVTIKISIRRDDIHLVIDSAKKYVPYFPIPIVVEGTSEKFKPNKYSLVGSCWKLGVKSNDNDGSRVVIGNVPYDLDVNSLALDKYNVRSFLDYNPVDFFLKVGDVDIVPSRDALKYTDKTKKAIKDAIEVMKQEIEGLITTELANCKSDWDRLGKIRDFRSSLRYPDGIGLSEEIGGLDFKFGIVRELADLQALDPSISFTIIGTSGGSSKITLMNPTDGKIAMHLDEAGKTHKTFVVFDDTVKDDDKGVRVALSDRCVHKTRAGRAAKYGHSAGHAIFIRQTKLTPDQICEFFGGMPREKVVKASEFTHLVPVRAKRGAVGTYKKLPIYRWDGYRRWDRVEMPTLNSTYFYLPLQKVYSKWAYNGVRSLNTLEHSYAALSGNKNGVLLYGVKVTEIAKLNPAVWKNFETEIETLVLAEIKKPGVEKSLCEYGTEELSSYRELFDIVETAQLTTSPFKEFSELYESRRDGTTDIKKLIQYLNFTPQIEKYMEALRKKYKIVTVEGHAAKIYAKYPMMKFLVALKKKPYQLLEVLREDLEPLQTYVKNTK